jgi:hypothetical protein
MVDGSCSLLRTNEVWSLNRRFNDDRTSTGAPLEAQCDPQVTH